MFEAVKKLENSPEFKKYKKENQGAFLTHVFYMLDEANKNAVQVGYYNKDKDRITTFIVEGKSIIKNPEAEVFKEQETVMNPLDLSKVKIGVDDAVEIAENLQKEKYKENIPFKKIAILQHLPVGQVWNITFVTQTFKTLNIKVDAKTGEIASEKLLSIVDFSRK